MQRVTKIDATSIPLSRRKAVRYFRLVMLLLVFAIALSSQPVSPVVAQSGDYIGGMDIDGWCKTLHGQSAEAVRIKPGVYGWNCKVGSSIRGIDLAALCKSQHNDPLATSGFTNIDDPYSWGCYSPRNRPQPGPAPVAAPQPAPCLPRNSCVTLEYGTNQQWTANQVRLGQCTNQTDQDWIVTYNTNAGEWAQNPDLSRIRFYSDHWYLKEIKNRAQAEDISPPGITLCIARGEFLVGEDDAWLTWVWLTP
jgi:hypothetical protein